MVKKSTCHCRPRFKPWVRKTPWRRECLPNLVFFNVEFQGQRRLVGYSTCVRKELDTTEQLTLSKILCSVAIPGDGGWRGLK